MILDLKSPADCEGLPGRHGAGRLATGRLLSDDSHARDQQHRQYLATR